MARMVRYTGEFPTLDGSPDVMEAIREQQTALAELQKVSDALPDGEIVGALISFPVADGQAFYVVTKERPLTVAWIDAMDGYHAGDATIRGLRRADIEKQLRFRRVWTEHGRADDEWWDRQPIGSTLHYHNGFGQYVRGEVRILDDGSKGIQPLALVGEWRGWDLPRRLPDGRIVYGYHAEKIITGTGAWRPSATCVYESPTFGAGAKARQVDPRTLDPIPLEVPPMTPDEHRTAELFQTVAQIEEALQDVTPDNVSDRLGLVRELAGRA